jgi:hypothetical protein
LLVMLTLLFGVLAFLAADGWQRGELMRKLGDMAWPQTEAVMENMITQPIGSDLPATGPTKSGS